MWGLAPWPGMGPESTVLGAWSISHRTTRDIPAPIPLWPGLVTPDPITDTSYGVISIYLSKYFGDGVDNRESALIALVQTEINIEWLVYWMGFPSGSVVKNPPAIQKTGLIPGSGRSPGEGNGKPLQYSCLGNPIDKGDWQATVHGLAKSWVWLRNQTTTTTSLPCVHSSTSHKTNKPKPNKVIFLPWALQKHSRKFIFPKSVVLPIT